MIPPTFDTRLDGRVAVVTGVGHVRSIGFATCRLLADHGADICFTHWQPAGTPGGPGDEHGPAFIADELRRAGVRVAALEIDLGGPDVAERVLDFATRELGPPSILINNAAHSTRDGYEQLTAAEFDRHQAVNARATAMLSVCFARRFRDDADLAQGRIVNLTSGQSLGAMPGELAYIASKGAIEAFTRTLAFELAPLGITVNAVNPGPVDTGYMDEGLRAAVLERTKSGRLAMPADPARLILFLVSAAGAWVTGQVLHTEGGFLR
jgi:3-oxoacyl-[acyl-carrier protein] reductase